MCRGDGAGPPAPGRRAPPPWPAKRPAVDATHRHQHTRVYIYHTVIPRCKRKLLLLDNGLPPDVQFKGREFLDNHIETSSYRCQFKGHDPKKKVGLAQTYRMTF